ncbi:amino acid adenylation domain-containing protein, partial [Paraburkholderia agricolaris]
SLIQARHESLRSRFEEVDGTPWQVIDGTPYGWAQYDLATAADADRDTELKSLLAQLSSRPFDLEHGPLLRVSLVRVGGAEHVLHFAMHHIVSDAWSIGVLTREFATLYQALSEGAEAAASPLAPLPVQYGDYAVWQREWLDASRLDAQLDYWRARLGDEHPVLELPVTRKRTGLRSAAGGRVVRRLEAHRAQALRALSQRHGATLFMTLLAAYDVLLSRYSAQQDIRVGVPVAGRDRLETEGLIGFFVNTLVIRTELAGVQRFGALLGQVRTRVVEAQAHQDLPFARLVDALQPARSLGHTPLFQAMFNYTGASRETVALPGLKVSALSGEAHTARFDLVLNVAEDEGLSVSLSFARDVFDEPVVARMLEHYVEILGQVSARDDAYLGEITLAMEDRYRTAIARHGFAPVGERFAAQARRRGTAGAVHCEGERLDYRALEAWSNRVARHLVERGAGADERIGLCLTRSAGLVASVLGVLKSGAAFVPLDPDYPEDRLAYMMEDAGVSRVVVDAVTAQRHAGLLAGRETIALEALRNGADGAGETGEESPAPAVSIHPDQLAYVIYTSGSTGRPKGVAISHGALCSHLEDFIGTYGIGETDKQLQSSTINFDVSLHEMLPALLCGGQIEMRGPQLWDLATTSRHLAEEGVTFSRIPTAYWQQWLREPPAAQSLRALRQITVGGEGLPGDALRQWREGPLGHIRLDNLYGPTETTVACLYRQTRAEDIDHAIVPIGVPYGSRTVYVLDEAGNEVPVGGLGELCIGGETLARGYLNRAAQTAEKFIPDPYRTDGARLYRTGDLCRRREDGTIDFLGRLDQQVKLRGFRIELGEIEAVLRQVAGVREAVVELKGEGEGRRLVGYVSGEAGAALETGTLRGVLEARLPGYMVPGAFVVLERLPVMQNGKVDRRALPEPQVQGELERVAPRTPLEAALLAIWQGVLGRDDIGVTDNFFEVGGDS